MKTYCLETSYGFREYSSNLEYLKGIARDFEDAGISCLIIECEPMYDELREYVKQLERERERKYDEAIYENENKR